MKNNLLFVFILFIIIFLTACPNPQSYPEEPNITFKKIIITNISDLLGNQEKNCRIVFSIIDGDGNIGIKDSDTTGIFDPTDSLNIYRNDLYFNFYKIDNGQTILVYDSIGARTPYIEPQGQNKTIKADIMFDYTIGYTEEGVLKYDSVMFEFFMFDRLQNRSNTETTPTLKIDTIGEFNL